MGPTYAIIPARSGSRGLTNKNIAMMNGRELMAYSILFARELNVDRIFCSTDSDDYASIARKWGAEVPFLRSASASGELAMEEDVINDLYSSFEQHSIPRPGVFVWLRPTFVFREVEKVNKAISDIHNDISVSAVRSVIAAEPRLYTASQGGVLTASFDDDGRSMVRRQEMKPHFQVFNTDVFRGTSGKATSQFLGKRVGYQEMEKPCGLDIDDAFDFALVETLLRFRPELVSRYLPIEATSPVAVHNGPQIAI